MIWRRRLITGLADTALLFATDSEQTWQGYRQLFSHWQSGWTLCAMCEGALALVRALTPKSDREAVNAPEQGLRTVCRDAV